MHRQLRSTPAPVERAVAERDLTVVAVLSGNRNFEGRIHPQVRASYLASPPLCVAYALAGTIMIDLTSEPLGHDAKGQPVMLAELWPTADEIQDALASVRADQFRSQYAEVFEGDARWQRLPSPEGALFEWDLESTYVREPPFFAGIDAQPEPPADIEGARVLALLGDSVTTDHISPAGAIPSSEPAGMYLREHGTEPRDFNSFGARRGNHEVMMRGTFANIRLRNKLVDPKEGGYTLHLPTGDRVALYEAARRYAETQTPLLVLAGREYGSGSSRDWAAKGTKLLGIRAVLAQSFERIHRSNLVGMGVLPLQFVGSENVASLGLDGTETYAITGITDGLEPRKRLHVKAQRGDGTSSEFDVECRIDSEVEVDYYRSGGVLDYVLRELG